MTVTPAARAVARPLELIVAISGFDDVQVAPGVTSSLVPFAVVPVATNCSVPPICTVGFAGDSAIETTVSLDTKKFPHPTSKTISNIAHDAVTYRRVLLAKVSIGVNRMLIGPPSIQKRCKESVKRR